MKTRITFFAAIFMLTQISVKAQINLPKNKAVKSIELNKGVKPNLKLSTALIDGIIGELIDGRYQIYWTANSGVVCCFKTIKEALNTYPKKNLKYVDSGFAGGVYQETSNGGIGQEIPNASIGFRKQNSIIAR